MRRLPPRSTRTDTLLPATTLVRSRSGLRLLEPSSGDGAFIRGVARSSIRDRVESIDAVELLESEAAKSAIANEESAFEGSVATCSAIEWAATSDALFDAAMGNPPFVRFPFVSKKDRGLAEDEIGRGQVCNIVTT